MPQTASQATKPTGDFATKLADWGAPLLSELGLSIYDIELVSGRLVVMVDKPGGVGLDEIARCTRGLSAILDEKDPIAGHYTLEVSSPGLERRLRTIDHRRSAIGETVKCKARDHEGVVTRLEGVLASVDDTASVITTASGDTTVPHDEVTSMRTVFAWPQPKSTKRPSSKT